MNRASGSVRGCGGDRGVRGALPRALGACLLVAALASAPAHAELFLDIGAHASDIEEVRVDVPARTSSDAGAHVGFGARGDVGERSTIGVRIEVDEGVEADMLLAVRAFDYAYHFNERFAATAFLGAARLDLPTAAYGYYFGGGVRFKDLMPRWDLSVELRFADELARDNLLPDDPTPGFATFYEVTSVSVYLSRRF